MNKLLLSVLGLAALGFVSCDDESYDDWTKTTEKQKYSQEAIIDLGMKATPSFSNVILDPTNKIAYIIDVEYSLPADAEVTHNLAISETDEYSSSTTFYTLKDNLFSVQENQIIISVDQLQKLVTSAFGNAPKAREFYFIDKIDYSIGGNVYAACVSTEKVTVTPAAPVIEESYFVVGSIQNWAITDPSLLFSHSGKDVYEDPVFTIRIDAPKAEDKNIDFEFKVAPISASVEDSWSNVWGVNKENIESLKQGDGTDNLKVTAVEGALFYDVTVNLLEGTYSITPISFQEFVYTPGSHNGWDGSKGAIHSPDMDGNYSGYVALGGEWGWKVKDGDTWYGAGATAGTLDAAGGNNDEGSEVTVNYLKVNLAELSFEKTLISAIGLAGEFNGWDAADAATHMTVSVSEAGEVSYTITLDMTAGEFKFVVNDGWDLNFGGTFDSLSNNGANLKIEEAGNYTITLYPSYDGNSNCTVKKN